MTKVPSILVVDDNRASADAISAVLSREGWQAETAYDGASAITRLEARSFSLVLTDLRMEPVDGMQVVKAAGRCHPPAEVIVFTAYGSVESAVEAMRLGARDFLTKPVTAQVLVHRVAELFQGSSSPGDPQIVGASEFSIRFRQELGAVARVRSAVLLRGEAGVGRFQAARWLHRHGLDRALDFHALDLWDLPRWGDLSRHGTVLLRRVESLDEDRATAVLRLMDQQVLGAAPRFIATTAGRPGDEGWDGPAKMELYYRLAVVEMDIPPLRARPADVAPLLEHFAIRFGDAFKREPVRPTAQQLAALEKYIWPGNIREMANFVERAVVLGGHAYDLPHTHTAALQGPTTLPVLGDGFNLSAYLESLERTLLVRALELAGGDRVLLGQILGLERNTLRYKLKKYGLLDGLERS